jgi:hypothetical protein
MCWGFTLHSHGVVTVSPVYGVACIREIYISVGYHPASACSPRSGPRLSEVFIRFSCAYYNAFIF